MQIINYCLASYRKGDTARHNGHPANEDAVSTMLYIIYTTYINGLLEPRPSLINMKELLSLEISSNGRFDRHSLADVIALTFEVVTESNRNPQLWSEAEIKEEIIHTFDLLYHGAMGAITQSGKGPINGIEYSVVKETLHHEIEKSHNPLRWKMH